MCFYFKGKEGGMVLIWGRRYAIFRLNKVITVFFILFTGIIIGIVVASYRGEVVDYKQTTSNELDFTPMYTDMPIVGIENSVGQNVIIFISKSEFERVDISSLKDMYEHNDAVTFVFNDKTALVYIKADNTLHFADYNEEGMRITMK